MMNFKVLALAGALAISAAATAQADREKYKKHAAEVRQAVWDWTYAPFKERNVPVEYNKFSSVTIAKRIEISASTKKLSFLSNQKEYAYIKTVREMVKINDKAALDEYSEISYQQFEKKSSFLESGTSTTIIGARLIKPNGTVREVNADEIVLTKESKASQQAKLAISDLQVGDIVDYFVSVEEKMVMTKQPESSFFVFGSEEPIMNYSVHCIVGEKYAVEYRAMNGAPDFKQTRNDDDEIVLDAEQSNIQALPISLWMSSFRQVPILRLRVVVGYKGLYSNRFNSRKPGEVYRNQPLQEIMEDEAVAIAVDKSNMNSYYHAPRFYKEVKDLLKKSNPDYEDLPKNQLAELIYYAFRFVTTYDVSATDEIEVGLARNYAGVNAKKYLFYLNEVMRYLKINSELALVTSKFGPVIKEAMENTDFEYIIVVNEDKKQYFGVESLFTPAFFVPSEFEGIDKAPTFITGSLTTTNPKNFKEGTASIPVTTWDKNMQTERLNLSFDPKDMQLINVQRQTSENGHYKSDDQKRLLLFEDYYEAERKALGIDKSLTEELNKKKKTRSLSEEYVNAFAKAREDVKDRFKAEIQAQFGIKPKELLSYKIDTLSIRHTEPAFVYSTQFTFDGLVKKAGNNYIFDVGKMIGDQLQLKPWQRTRKVDVYMPFARALQYNISINIPDGYTAQGVEKLNQQVNTDAGAFAVIATAANNKVNISIQKIYRHGFESAAKWPEILKVLDAAVDFESSKLLLKKS